MSIKDKKAVQALDKQKHKEQLKLKRIIKIFVINSVGQRAALPRIAAAALPNELGGLQRKAGNRP